MPVALFPQPEYLSATDAAAATASTAAPGPKPEAVLGSLAAPEVYEELWEIESRAWAYGKWSSDCDWDSLDRALPTSLSSAWYPGSYTAFWPVFVADRNLRYSGWGEWWLRDVPGAARRRY
jgi:hypothetical protein